MISVKELSKTIGHNKILDSISFEVRDGEILGFLGPNGAGKSTTMKIITGFWTPTAGNVHVGDLNVIQNSLAIRQKIGYLPETVPLYNEMKVYEYLKFIAEIRDVPKDKIKDRIKSVIKDCGLEKVIKKPIEELSKGYRQRVGLAQAIIHEPDILILDEPTTGLDPNQIVEIRNLVKQIGRDKTIIFSTHILSEVQATCDRVVIINNGRIAGQGTPNELMQSAGAREIVYVKIKGPQDIIKEKLKEIEAIMEIMEKDREADDIFGYEIQPRAGADVREHIAGAVMRNNWSILEFNRKSVSMEDVFRELTK
ncbi:ABC transporter [Candidatus Falkowbacteria bacterium CG10_big_fil_rev_8_21_14_0_10_43_10]|uniref:ABC transporter n=1 Tax=Candidatus Falkowbacteria bacterium CG10_big_fil_rev_8_21_14_0_10_43_10 TaxID=1974567 RepID=A0A2H0V2G7_9BACT|nr:MAG: ABC transporter [Candidatus Falkowbacteria bacterium CG10_big_fil_rev_8_21_14_0_10_43_10]